VEQVKLIVQNSTTGEQQVLDVGLVGIPVEGGVRVTDIRLPNGMVTKLPTPLIVDLNDTTGGTKLYQPVTQGLQGQQAPMPQPQAQPANPAQPQAPDLQKLVGAAQPGQSAAYDPMRMERWGALLERLAQANPQLTKSVPVAVALPTLKRDRGNDVQV
jgi:hypothetical protein